MIIKHSFFLNNQIRPMNQIDYESRAVIKANLKLAHDLALDLAIIGKPIISGPWMIDTAVMSGAWIEELLSGIVQLDEWCVIDAYLNGVA